MPATSSSGTCDLTLLGWVTPIPQPGAFIAERSGQQLASGASIAATPNSLLGVIGSSKVPASSVLAGSNDGTLATKLIDMIVFVLSL
jgi:hypothetical protein